MTTTAQTMIATIWKPEPTHDSPTHFIALFPNLNNSRKTPNESERAAETHEVLKPLILTGARLKTICKQTMKREALPKDITKYIMMKSVELLKQNGRDAYPATQMIAEIRNVMSAPNLSMKRPAGRVM